MSWAVGFDTRWQRDIGYGVPAYCDHPECDAKIDRGLAYVCGGEICGGDKGCGLYFCEKHGGGTLCSRCNSDPGKWVFEPRPDHPDWIAHKMKDPSWAGWRASIEAQNKARIR